MIGKPDPHVQSNALELKELRRRCEELSVAVESMRTYYEDLLGSLQDGIIIVDPDGQICSINQAAEELTGVSAQIFHGRPFELIFPHDRSLQELVRKTIESGRTYADFDTRLTRQDGSKVVISAVASLISDGKGQARGTVLALRDQTGMRELEERLQRSDRLAALGTVAAGVAHEIRNPLAGLRGAAQLLEGERQFPHALREYTTVIVKEADRLSAIVEQLLSFATPRGPVLRSCNLHEILDSILFLERVPLDTAKITIQRQYDLQLPDILADPAEIRQLFLNVIRNGVEAMPGGGELTVRTWYEGSAKRCGGRSSAVTEIIDHGCGFNPEIERQLFTPFFTTKERGTGLGLAICLRIVEDHGGGIEATNLPDSGSRFRVWLPLVEEQPETVLPHVELHRFTYGAGL